MTKPLKRCARVGCPNNLKGKQVKYCGNACRRVQSTADKRALNEAVAMDVIRDTVKPVILEHLTEGVTQQLGILVDLLPKALTTLKAGLEADRTWTDSDGIIHEEPDFRERRAAAETILKYTAGNDSVKPVGAAAAPPAFNINFGMPSQGDEVSTEGSVLEVTEAEVVERPERECRECHETKPAEDFVGESARCQLCHDKMLDGMRERFPDLLPSRA